MTYDITSSTNIEAAAEASPFWCQNEYWCCTGGSCTTSSFEGGNAFDVILWRCPRNDRSDTATTAAASHLYFDFPWHTTRDSPGRIVCFEVWDGSQWLRFPVVGTTSGTHNPTTSSGVLRQRRDDEDALVLSHNTATTHYGSPENTPSNVTSPNRNMKMDRWGQDDSEEGGNDDDWFEKGETRQLLSPAPGTSSIHHHEHDPVALEDLAAVLPAGQSPARFLLLETTTQSMVPVEVLAIAPCTIHVWSTTDRLVIMDIDGSITRSNVMGLMDTLVLESYSHCHEGVCSFLSQLIQKTVPPFRGDLRILYLSSRPLSLSNYTRKFLTQVTQPPPAATSTDAEGIPPSSLPAGPFIGYPGSIADILHMELITHSVHTFKHKCLEESILTPRLQLGETSPPFWAALGNTWMDVQAYQTAGVPFSRMGFITKTSSIHILQPMVSPSAAQSTHTDLSPTTPSPGRFSERSFPGFRDPKLLEYFQHYAEEY